MSFDYVINFRFLLSEKGTRKRNKWKYSHITLPPPLFYPLPFSYMTKQVLRQFFIVFYYCFRWYLKFKCANCGEVPDHFQYISKLDKHPLKVYRFRYKILFLFFKILYDYMIKSFTRIKLNLIEQFKKYSNIMI